MLLGDLMNCGGRWLGPGNLAFESRQFGTTFDPPARISVFISLWQHRHLAADGQCQVTIAKAQHELAVYQFLNGGLHCGRIDGFTSIRINCRYNGRQARGRIQRTMNSMSNAAEQGRTLRCDVTCIVDESSVALLSHAEQRGQRPQEGLVPLIHQRLQRVASRSAERRQMVMPVKNEDAGPLFWIIDSFENIDQPLKILFSSRINELVWPCRTKFEAILGWPRLIRAETIEANTADVFGRLQVFDQR